MTEKLPSTRNYSNIPFGLPHIDQIIDDIAGCSLHSICSRMGGKKDEKGEEKRGNPSVHVWGKERREGVAAAVSLTIFTIVVLVLLMPVRDLLISFRSRSLIPPHCSGWSHYVCYRLDRLNGRNGKNHLNMHGAQNDGMIDKHVVTRKTSTSSVEV